VQMLTSPLLNVTVPPEVAVAATMKDRNVMLWAAPVVETRWGSSCARLERTTRVKKCVKATFGGPSENISAAECAGFKR